MIVIGISGWRGSGKDTVGNYLRPFGYMRVAFADCLKQNVCDFYGLTRTHCEDRELKEAPLLHLPVFTGDAGSRSVATNYMWDFALEDGQKMQKNEIFLTADDGFAYLNRNGKFEKMYWTPRALMIMEGTTKRSVNSSYWVDQTVQKIENMSKGFKHFFVSDLRYISEAQRMKEVFGGQFVSIRVNRFSEIKSTDASERDLDDYPFDYVIENNSTLEDLSRKVDTLVRQVDGY